MFSNQFFMFSCSTIFAQRLVFWTISFLEIIPLEKYTPWTSYHWTSYHWTWDSWTSYHWVSYHWVSYHWTQRTWGIAQKLKMLWLLILAMYLMTSGMCCKALVTNSFRQATASPRLSGLDKSIMSLAYLLHTYKYLELKECSLKSAYIKDYPYTLT